MVGCEECERLRAELAQLKAELKVARMTQESAVRAYQFEEARRVAAEHELDMKTRKLERGKRRSAKPARAADWLNRVDSLIASEAIAGRQITQRDALRAVLTVQYIRERKLSGGHLAELVDGRLSEAERTVSRERGSRKKAHRELVQALDAAWQHAYTRTVDMVGDDAPDFEDAWVTEFAQADVRAALALEQLAVQ